MSSLDSVIDQAINKAVESTPKPETQPKAAAPATKKEPIQSEPEEETEIEEVEDEVEGLKEEPEEDEEAEEDPEKEAEKKALTKPFKKEAKKEVEKPRIERIIEDGVEREITIDELKKGFQKASVSGKRFEEASVKLKQAEAIQKDFEDFVDFANENPIIAMYELLGEQRMNDALTTYRKEMADFEKMSDVERENFILKRQINSKKIATGFKQVKEAEALSNVDAQRIREDLIPKVQKVFKDKEFGSQEMKARLFNKMKSYTANRDPKKTLDYEEIELLADQVKEDTKRELTSFTKDLDGEDLVNFLGEEMIEKIRKQLVSRFKTTSKAVKVEPTTTEEPKKTRQNQKTLEDYRKFWQNPT